MPRIAAIGDLHATATDPGRFAPLFAEMGREADLVLLAGDLLDLGREAELELLLADMAECAAPVVCVLGNHDYYSGEVPALTQSLRAAGVTVLEHEIFQFGDLDIIGFKGTIGGFNKMLAPIAEPEVVAFANLSKLDAERFERTISSSTSARRLVLLHHAPIVDTIVGEAVEEYVFMGSSRYAEVIDRHRPEMVIHGHSHFGTLEGRTPGGVRVFNVAMQIPRPDGRIYSLFDV